MRSLAQPQVLARASLAALITSLICCPRLALWTERVGSVWILWFVLFSAMIVLWSFVFAWHGQYSRRPPLNFDFKPGVWTAATLYALAVATFNYFLDPHLRLIFPGEYPANLDAWVSMCLFQLGFAPLFFCFAPFAFFIRLTRRQETSIALTILFGVFVLALRVNSYPQPIPFGLAAQMIFLRAAGGFITLYFYLKAGAFIIWWVILLIQLRQLLELAAAH